MVYFGWYHYEPYRKETKFSDPVIWYEYLKNIIRLDLCNGLRREVAGKAMPFGQVPEGFLFCPPLWVIGMIVGNKTQLMRRKMK